MARTTGPPGRSVASKLFEVLDCFATGEPSLSLADVASRTHLPPSTARRLLTELVSWGGLEQLPSGKYRVGLRLWEIGACAVEQRTIREISTPYMQDLYEATRQVVQLVVLDDLSGLCVARVNGRRTMPLRVDVGGRIPLHATATGKALLAFAAPTVFKRATEAGLAPYTDYTLASPTSLARALREVQVSRLAYSKEEHTLGSQAVASPIMDQRRVVGSIGVIGPVSKDFQQLGSVIRTVAAAISRQLAA